MGLADLWDGEYSNRPWFSASPADGGANGLVGGAARSGTPFSVLMVYVEYLPI